MSKDGEKRMLELLERFVVASERLAQHFSPPARERHTAILGTATYTREDRDRKELRDKLKAKK